MDSQDQPLRQGAEVFGSAARQNSASCSLGRRQQGRQVEDEIEEPNSGQGVEGQNKRITSGP